MPSPCRYVLNRPGADLVAVAEGLALDAEEAFACHRGIPGYTPTPLVRLTALAAALGLGDVWVKDEGLRFGLNSFKALGAAYAVRRALAGCADRPVFCTATDGNHGRAVAWAARSCGCDSRVFVPQGTTAARIAAIAAEGARVEVVAGDYDAAVRASADEAERTGCVLVQDTAWRGYEEIPRRIMAGYTTALREIADGEQGETPLPRASPGVDCVLLQAGVGSWAAAAAWWLAMRYGARRPRIVCVEPLSADGLLQSSLAGRIVTARDAGKRTVMDGLDCPTPSALAWPLLHAAVDAFVAIPDSLAIEAAARWRDPRGGDRAIAAGASGAAGFAGLLAIMEDSQLTELRDNLRLGPAARVLVVNTESPAS